VTQVTANFIRLYERLKNNLKAWGGNTTLADNLAQLNSGLASGDVVLYPGDYKVSAKPTNSIGARIRGAGRILLADPLGGFQQLNSEFDDKAFVLGEEYLSAFHKRLLAGSPVKIVCSGDSTTAGTGLAQLSSYIDQQIAAAAELAGFDQVTTANNGISGKTAYEWANVVGGSAGTPFVNNDIAAAPNLLVWRWGINDPRTNLYSRSIGQFAADVRAGLTAFRAAVPYTTCSIVLMNSNAVAYSQVNSDERWMEQTSKVLRQIAREFQCCYFEIYGRWRDPRDPAAGDYMDAPFANAVHIHPADCLALNIGSRLCDVLFPSNLQHLWGSTNLSNQKLVSRARLSADLPNTYRYGWSMNRATPANGFLLDGQVMTFRQVDNASFQINVGYNANADTFAFRIGGGGVPGAWQPWQKAIPSPANVNWPTAPVIAGTTTAGAQTYSSQVGNYQRYGAHTRINLYLAVSAKDAATAGNLQIPLPVSNRVGATFSVLDVAYGNWALTGGYTQIIAMVSGGNIQLQKVGPGLARANLVAADLANGAELFISGTYPTDTP